MLVRSLLKRVLSSTDTTEYAMVLWIYLLFDLRRIWIGYVFSLLSFTSPPVFCKIKINILLSMVWSVSMVHVSFSFLYSNKKVLDFKWQLWWQHHFKETLNVDCVIIIILLYKRKSQTISKLLNQIKINFKTIIISSHSIASKRIENIKKYIRSSRKIFLVENYPLARRCVVIYRYREQKIYQIYLFINARAR